MTILFVVRLIIYLFGRSMFLVSQLNIIVKSSESKYDDKEKEFINLFSIAIVVVVVLDLGKVAEVF